MTGPRATAPKMQTFMIIAVQRNFSRPKPSASGGTAAISSRLVHRPWIMCPAMNIAGLCAAAARIDPITSSPAYSTIIRRCGRSCANCTASTVPTAYPAFAMPSPRLIVCMLMCSCPPMIGVSGCSAAESPR